MESSSSAHGFAGGWPARRSWHNSLSVCRSVLSHSILREHYRAVSGEVELFRFSNAERPSFFRYQVVGGQRVSEFVLVALSHYKRGRLCREGKALRRLQSPKQTRAKPKLEPVYWRSSIIPNYAKTRGSAASVCTNANRWKSRCLSAELCLIPDLS